MLYKLLNNSIYGKTFENPMKYAILVMLSTATAYMRAAAKPGFDGTVYVQDDFAMAKMLYETVKYEKPLYLGATITELAKLHMFEFYYDVLQDYFTGDKKCELLFTDTDSMILRVTTHDIYEDIAKINASEKYGCPIDVSSFDPKIVEKYNIRRDNDKVIGAFKSETGSDQIAEFVGLRAKMYSYTIYGDEGTKHMRAKGVAKSSMNMLSHQNYLRCLFGYENPENARQSIPMRSIRSKKTQLDEH